MIEIRFTIKGEKDEKTFFPTLGNDGIPTGLRSVDSSYVLAILEEKGKFILADFSSVEEPEDVIRERMLGFSQEWMESQESGFDEESDAGESNLLKMDYGPDDIFVENKPFSLKQLMDLIDNEDIELSPTFQRNFIWDKTRQSKLIESILLGLPLPALYLSQYNDGRLTIVDGVQRISTIRKFLRNELVLSNLEYLKECNGKRWNQLSTVLSQLRIRKFDQTQILCFVIDYRSPQRLKYDLFRRLNTGGKPLNNQEIRNCLSRVPVQETLRNMAQSNEFIKATDKSVRDTRMEASEMALRFMYFYDQYSESSPTGEYNGDMDNTLDGYVELLNNRVDFKEYVEKYKRSLVAAYSLFGEQTFRKVYPQNYRVHRSPINKLLLLTETVLLAKFEEQYKQKISQDIKLVDELTALMQTNQEFFNAITWSTNSKSNINIAFSTIKRDLFDKYLLTK